MGNGMLDYIYYKLSGGMDDDNKYKYNGFYYGSKSELFKSSFGISGYR